MPPPPHPHHANMNDSTVCHMYFNLFAISTWPSSPSPFLFKSNVTSPLRTVFHTIWFVCYCLLSRWRIYHGITHKRTSPLHVKGCKTQFLFVAVTSLRQCDLSCVTCIVTRVSSVWTNSSEALSSYTAIFGGGGSLIFLQFKYIYCIILFMFPLQVIAGRTGPNTAYLAIDQIQVQRSLCKDIQFWVTSQDRSSGCLISFPDHWIKCYRKGVLAAFADFVQVNEAYFKKWSRWPIIF